MGGRFALLASVGLLCACSGRTFTALPHGAAASGAKDDSGSTGGRPPLGATSAGGAASSSGGASAGGAGAGGASTGGASTGGVPVGDAADGHAPSADAGDASPARCPTGLPGPRLVEVPATRGSSVGGHCVDATEVTNADYAAFLEAGVPTAGQRAVCAANDTYTPTFGWPARDRADYPVSYVDWCDAVAYCEWAHKHLCGSIAGGPNGYDDYADATRSAWYDACSAGGAREYPYADSLDDRRCVGPNFDGVPGFQPSDVAEPVTSAGCEGGYPGLFDMSGNVLEWEDACLDDQDVCRMRGGSFRNDSLGTGCRAAYYDARHTHYLDVGFRCCAAAER